MPPEKITLSEDEQDRLKEQLDEMIGDAEDFRNSSKYSDLKAMNWRQHFAEPKYSRRHHGAASGYSAILPMVLDDPSEIHGKGARG